MTGLAPEPAPGRTRVYRAAFVLSVGLYLSSFVMGLAYELLRNKRLPAYDMSPLSQAQEYLRRGDVQRAAQQYRMVARIDKASYDTPRQIAELLKSVGDPSGEIDQAEASRDLYPGKAAAHRNLAWAYHRNRRYDEALASFRQALALDPTDLQAQRGIAEVWLDRDRYPEAIEAYGRILSQQPSDATAHNGLAIALMQAGRRAEALRHFEEAVRLEPRFAANLQRAREQAGAPRP